MKRFWDLELNDAENNRLEHLLKDVPTFDEWCGIHAGGILPAQEDVDEYSRLYGEVIRAARDAVTE